MRFGQKAQLQLAAVATLTWAFVEQAAPHSWIKIGLSAAFMLLAPGFALLRLIRRDNKLPSLWEGIGYSLGLSVLFLMAVGLAVNTVLPIFGMRTPLSVLPLTLGVVAGVMAVLLQINRAGITLVPEIEKPRISIADMWVGYAAALAVILSVLGAVSLNNGGSNVFTVWMLTIISVVCLGIPWLGKWLSRNAIGLGVYLMGLAMLFATSLRGWFDYRPRRNAGISGLSIDVESLALEHELLPRPV